MTRISTNAAGALLLCALVLLSTRSLVLGVLGVLFSGFLLAVVALGPERLGTLLVWLAMFTAPMNDRDYRPLPGGPLTFSDLFFALGFLLLVGTMVRRRSRLPVDWAAGALLLVVAVLLAAAMSPTPAVGLNYGSRLIAAAVMLPAALLWWRPSRATIETLVWAYILGQVVSTMYSLAEGPTAGTRYDGLATHVNFFALGGLLAITMLVHKWYVVRADRRWIVVVCTVICLFSIWSSGSRAALLVLLVVGVMVPLVERTAVSAYAVLAGAGIAVVAAEWLVRRAGEGSAVARLMGDSSTVGSDQDRREALSLGFEKWLAHPVFGKAFGEDSLAAHNIYLQVMVGIGLLGLVGFLLVGFSAIRPLFGTGPLHRLGYAALAFAGVGLITNSLWDRFIWAALSLGILAGLPDDEESSTPLPLSETVEVS